MIPNASLNEHYSAAEFWQAFVLVARAQIEYEPAHTFVAARALPFTLYQEVLALTDSVAFAQTSTLSKQAFPLYLRRGVQAGLLDRRLLDFDLSQRTQALQSERDSLFAYPGLQTLYDRSFLQKD